MHKGPLSLMSELDSIDECGELSEKKDSTISAYDQINKDFSLDDSMVMDESMMDDSSNNLS